MKKFVTIILINSLCINYSAISLAQELPQVVAPTTQANSEPNIGTTTLQQQCPENIDQTVTQITGDGSYKTFYNMADTPQDSICAAGNRRLLSEEEIKANSQSRNITLDNKLASAATNFYQAAWAQGVISKADMVKKIKDATSVLGGSINVAKNANSLTKDDIGDASLKTLNNEEQFQQKQISTAITQAQRSLSRCESRQFSNDCARERSDLQYLQDKKAETANLSAAKQACYERINQNPNDEDTCDEESAALDKSYSEVASSAPMTRALRANAPNFGSTSAETMRQQNAQARELTSANTQATNGKTAIDDANQNGNQLRDLSLDYYEGINQNSATAINLARQAKEKALEVIKQRLNISRDNDYRMTEAIAERGEGRVNDKVAELMGAVTGATFEVQCSDIGDTRCVSYHLYVAASAIYLAHQISAASAFVDNVCDWMWLRMPSCNNQQMWNLERAAGIIDVAINHSDFTAVNRELLESFLHFVNIAAQRELEDKINRVAAAEKRVAEAKAWVKEDEAMIKNITIMMAAIMTLYYMHETLENFANSMKGTCSGLHAAVCLAAWTAKQVFEMVEKIGQKTLWVAYAALMAWYVFDLVKAKKALASAEKELDQAKIHTHMACQLVEPADNYLSPNPPLQFVEPFEGRDTYNTPTVNFQRTKNIHYVQLKSRTNIINFILNGYKKLIKNAFAQEQASSSLTDITSEIDAQKDQTSDLSGDQPATIPNSENQTLQEIREDEQTGINQVSQVTNEETSYTQILEEIMNASAIKKGTKAATDFTATKDVWAKEGVAKFPTPETRVEFAAAFQAAAIGGLGLAQTNLANIITMGGEYQRIINNMNSANSTQSTSAQRGKINGVDQNQQTTLEAGAQSVASSTSGQQNAINSEARSVTLSSVPVSNITKSTTSNTGSENSYIEGERYTSNFTKSKQATRNVKNALNTTRKKLSSMGLDLKTKEDIKKTDNSTLKNIQSRIHSLTGQNYKGANYSSKLKIKPTKGKTNTPNDTNSLNGNFQGQNISFSKSKMGSSNNQQAINIGDNSEDEASYMRKLNSRNRRRTNKNNLSSNEINENSELNIFKIISKRYQKNAYPVLIRQK